jgi:hypothetical protein
MGDIYLYLVPEYGDNDIVVALQPRVMGVTVSGGLIDTRGRGKRQPTPEELQRMPIEAQTLFGNLTTQYGDHTGRYVYYRMKQENLGPFKPGAKYGPKRA